MTEQEQRVLRRLVHRERVSAIRQHHCEAELFSPEWSRRVAFNTGWRTLLTCFIDGGLLDSRGRRKYRTRRKPLQLAA